MSFCGMSSILTRRAMRSRGLDDVGCGHGRGFDPETCSLGTAGFDDARAAGEVWGRRDVLVAETLQRGEERFRTAVGRFEHDPAAGTENVAGAAGDLLADPLADECVLRLVKAD